MFPAVDQETLASLVRDCRPLTKRGKVADYIPELAYANPHALGIAVASADGGLLEAGDARQRFTLQSVSKILTLTLALHDCGAERVFAKVGMEPSVDPFNSIVKLETVDHKKPLNPMINAGAIVVASLLVQKGGADRRLEDLKAIVADIVGRSDLDINRSVYESERKTGDRNRALAYFMKSTGVIDADVDVEETLDFYFKACSLEVDCVDLARIGLFFAMRGKCLRHSPDGAGGSGGAGDGGIGDGGAGDGGAGDGGIGDDGAGDGAAAGGCMAEELVSPDIARIVTTIMITSGMYNRSGEFFLKVGLPAKSGVSGGIVAFVPGKCGFGVYGPAIDDAGNSVAGVRLLEELSLRYGLHLVG